MTNMNLKVKVRRPHLGNDQFSSKENGSVPQMMDIADYDW